MTLDDLDAVLARPDIGSITLSRAVNGKFYATVHFGLPDGQFRPEHQWADSSAAGLQAILDRPQPTAPARNALEDLL